jgi:hypothetical protein
MHTDAVDVAWSHRPFEDIKIMKSHVLEPEEQEEPAEETTEDQ